MTGDLAGLEYLIAVLAGLLLGSFGNVCVYRLPLDLSVVRPRSFCPRCEAGIAWYDNIPLVSFALLGGSCRHCRAAIPWRYPLVELLTVAAFVSAVQLRGFTPEGAKLALFSWALIVLIFSDFEEHILPDEFTLGGVLAGLIFAWFVPVMPGLVSLFSPAWDARLVSMAESAAGALIPSLTIWSVGELYYRVRKREGLGLGDVKMVAMFGAFLGLQEAMQTMIIGSVLGSVIGLIFIKAAGKDAATYELPFGSFLGTGAVLVTHLMPRLF
ncbi:MAG: prepilin peptidase [Acidobacteria bacterium]|nr:prepilin peptidase [Acidobacteriota bacterium]